MRISIICVDFTLSIHSPVFGLRYPGGFAAFSSGEVGRPCPKRFILFQRFFNNILPMRRPTKTRFDKYFPGTYRRRGCNAGSSENIHLSQTVGADCLMNWPGWLILPLLQLHILISSGSVLVWNYFLIVCHRGTLRDGEQYRENSAKFLFLQMALCGVVFETEITTFHLFFSR